MVNKVWIGSADSLNNPAAWSPSGVPVAGDTATIENGTAIAHNQELDGFELRLVGLNSTLDIKDVRLGPTFTLTALRVLSSGPGGGATLNAVGHNTNSGLIQTTGVGPGLPFTINIGDATDGGLGGRERSIFRNNGTISAAAARQFFRILGQSPDSLLENNGLIHLDVPFVHADIAVPIQGHGTIVSGRSVTPAFSAMSQAAIPSVNFGAAVGSGENFVFSHVARIGINQPLQFHALIHGFEPLSSGTSPEPPVFSFFQPRISLPNIQVTSYDVSHNVLSLWNGSQLVGKLRFTGFLYTKGNFKISSTAQGTGIEPQGTLAPLPTVHDAGPEPPELGPGSIFVATPEGLPGQRGLPTEDVEDSEDVRDSQADLVLRPPPELPTLPTIPDQSPAPVRVEERNGRVSRISDRDSPLGAAERDFNEWREPVLDHIQEMLSCDFRPGTNHSRARDRLVALAKLLSGGIAEMKDCQFRIGYEIERFGGLVSAYRSGGDDMPTLSADVLEDLDRLRIALMMGIAKLERWAEFRRAAAADPMHDGDANSVVLSEGLTGMAVEMERRPTYFDPELPETFRFLAEATRDPRGATRTVVYGGVRSTENLISFLGRKALGIGAHAVGAVEQHISKAVATALITALSGAALTISGAVPAGWAWLKPLLEALARGGGG